MSTQPVALYAQKVPPGGILIPATANPSAMFRVTMAAIDPDALPETEETGKPPRATLKIVRPPPGLDLEDDEDWEDDDEEDEDEDEEDSDDEERNGGPSDPAKSKKARQAAALKEMEDAMDEDEDEDESGDDEINLQAAISKLIKGKAKATSEDGSEVSEDLEMDEVVICTLDPEKHYQQPVDFVVAEDDRIFFKVTGTHAIYLTGNYVMPTDGLGERDSDDDEEDEDYDLSPDEDELELMDEDDESDELDDLENPRVTEIASDEEDVPKKVKAADAKGKGKNKRAAADSDEEAGDLDTMMANSMKPANGAVDGEAKLSKKQQKKLKKNNGEAAEVQTKTTEAPNGTKTDKKVQFAKNLEQGPTPSPSQKDAGKQAGTTGVLGVKEVQGVTVDDKVLGKGPAAKKGNNVSMRYIGKLQNGQVFDANKKGKPFSFKLGSGEVIKGWDIGIAGMAVGGERRVTIPPHLAYGKKAIPGIPANSKLIFDVKLLAIK